MVYKTLHLGKVNHQESRWKVRIYEGEKATFRKGVWFNHLITINNLEAFLSFE